MKNRCVRCRREEQEIAAMLIAISVSGPVQMVPPPIYLCGECGKYVACKLIIDALKNTDPLNALSEEPIKIEGGRQNGSK